MTEQRGRRFAVCALLAVAAVLGGCGSKKPPPVEAVSVPRDALRMGMQSYDDAQFVAATQLFAKALTHYRSIDDARGQVVALMDLADVALVQGEHARAALDLTEAERIVQRDRLPGFAPHLALLECQQLAQADDAAGARAKCEAVLAVAEATPPMRAGARIELAKLALAEGKDWNAERPALAKAVDADGRATTRARLLRLDADAARRAGRFDEAYATLQKALAIYQAALTRPGIAASHEELGAVAGVQEKYAIARDHYERALNIRLWMSDRVHGAMVLEALATLEMEHGDAARAARITELLDYLRGANQLEWRIVQQKYEAL